MKRLTLWIYSKLGSSINKYPRVELKAVPYYYTMDRNFSPVLVNYPFVGFIVYLDSETPVPYTLFKRPALTILTERFASKISISNSHLCPVQLAEEELYRSNLAGVFDPHVMNSHFLLGGNHDE